MLPLETTITVDELKQAVADLKAGEARLVTITVLRAGESYGLIYHFDVDGELHHLRLIAIRNGQVPSIGEWFPSSFLIENEINEHSDVKIEGLLVDFQGHMLHTDMDDGHRQEALI